MRALPLLLVLPGVAATAPGAIPAPPQRRVAVPVPDYVCSWERGIDPPDWLLDHQEPDGHWDADGFGRYDAPEAPGVPGRAGDDVAVTAWVVLAWLGDGEYERWREPLQRALGWLADAVDPEGDSPSASTPPSLGGRALATLALTEALHLRRGADRAPLRPRVRRALAELARRADPQGGWTADGGEDSPIDARTTACAILALVRADRIGLGEDDPAAAAAARLAALTDDGTGAFGPQGDPTATAWAIVGRLAAGHTPEEHPELLLGAQLLVDGLDTLVEAGRTDPERCLATGLATYPLGGRLWNRFSRAAKPMLLGTGRTEPGLGRDRPVPCDPELCPEGSVAATALWGLTMELYYRYIRVLWI